MIGRVLKWFPMTAPVLNCGKDNCPNNGGMQHSHGGFGFIVGEDGVEYFVHITWFVNGLEILYPGQTVMFDPMIHIRGPRAYDVKLFERSIEDVSKETREETDSEETRSA